VRLVEDVPFAERMVAQQLWFMGHTMPDAPPEMVRRMAEESAKGMEGGIFGVYDVVEKQVYLAKGTMQAKRQQAGLSVDHEADLLKVVMAHEVTHALEDQIVGFDTLVPTLGDAEHFEAASCVWEGWATWVEGRVAEDLAFEDAFWKMNRLQGWGPNGIEDPAAWSVAFRYGLGYFFVDHHVAEGGTDQAWATLQSPPPHTGMIYRPETYEPTAQPAPRDYKALLSGVEHTLTRGDWLAQHGRVGESTLRGAAVHDRTGLPELELALSHLVWAHQIALSRPDRDATIQVLEFDTADAAREWLRLLRKQKLAYTAHFAGQLGRPIEVLTEPLEGVSAEQALLRTENLPPPLGEQISGWAQQDNLAVVVSTKHFRPGLRMGRTLDAILERLAAHEP
jgi:hypothetical protein